MTSNTLITSEFDHSDEHLRVEPSHPVDGKIFLGIEDRSLREHRTASGRYVHIDADELRDAIDKAVGKREEAAAAKPYRPIDRDRLLRHIEDLEATLTRRNERHERDQERIRELEAERARLEAEVFHDYTARECLELAWEAAIVPEDGMIREGEEYVLQGISGRVEGPLRASMDRRSVTPIGPERRLLEPRTEPSEEGSYRKELESKGLAEWEIELLVGAAA